MEDWIVVQPCPVCGLKRLILGEAVYVPHYKSLQWVYICTGDGCYGSGTFGYKTRAKKEIILHDAIKA